MALISTKKKAADKVRDVAAELLEIQAKRHARQGLAIDVDRAMYEPFAATFPFEETPDQHAAIEAVLRAEGLFTTRSSIHTHGAVAPFDKWSGAVWAARTLLGRDLPAELDRWVAVGDSGNDEAMFRHFRHSVGVANIIHAAPRMQHLPRYVSTAERGAGFAELAQALLAARGH